MRELARSCCSLHFLRRWQRYLNYLQFVPVSFCALSIESACVCFLLAIYTSILSVPTFKMGIVLQNDVREVSYYQQQKFPQISCTEMKFQFILYWDEVSIGCLCHRLQVGRVNASCWKLKLHCTAFAEAEISLTLWQNKGCNAKVSVTIALQLSWGVEQQPHIPSSCTVTQRGRCAGQEGTAISIPFLLCSVLHPSCSRAHWMGEAPRCTLRFSGPFPHQGLLQRGCTGLGEQGQLSANPVVKVDGRACLRSSAPCFDGHDLLEWRRKNPYCPPRVKLAETVLFCRWTLALLAPSALRFSLFFNLLL